MLLTPKQEQQVRQATQNNLEPMAFSFGSGGFGDVVSDKYSFFDEDTEAMKATGNGGLRQMHNYVDLNYSDNISTPPVDDGGGNRGANKISKDLTIEQLQQQRESELQKITGVRPPMV